jgi:predicted secreted acid phosphatase
LYEQQILLYGTPKEQRRQSFAAQYEILFLLDDTLYDFSDVFNSQQTAKERATAVLEALSKVSL